MGQTRDILERHLQRAKRALQEYSDKLASKKLDQKQLRRDPTWRKLDARLRKVNSRLQSVSLAESILNTMVQATLEKQNQPKVQAPKKAKVAAEPKAEKKPREKKQAPAAQP